MTDHPKTLKTEIIGTLIGMLPYFMFVVTWGISVEVRLRSNDASMTVMHATAQEQTAQVDRRLDRIEGKVDRLLEREVR